MSKASVMQFISELPSVPAFPEKGKLAPGRHLRPNWLPLLLPDCPAVYFVLQNGKVLYIGSTKWLYSRWGQHHIRNFLKDRQSIRIAWVKVRPENLTMVESQLIRKVLPPFNRAGHRHLSKQSEPEAA